jgi:hypothetical protein
VFILEIDLLSSCFSRYLSQIFDDETSIETHYEEGSAQDPSRKIMTPSTFNVKFPYDTRFTFRSLTFAVVEDENLEMLPQGQHQSASHWYMDKLHIFRPSHLQQVVSTQVWILMQGYISAPSSSSRAF